MEYRKQNLRQDAIPDETTVRFNGLYGRKVHVPGTIHPLHVAVVFAGHSIHHLHCSDLETPVIEPDPPKVEYIPTDFYQETSTGALYKRQYGQDGWHLICVSQIKPSIKVTSCESSHPEGFRRLYKEA